MLPYNLQILENWILLLMTGYFLSSFHFLSLCVTPITVTVTNFLHHSHTPQVLNELIIAKNQLTVELDIFLKI